MIDGLANVELWRPRAIEARGRAEAIHDLLLRIHREPDRLLGQSVCWARKRLLRP